ncbi:MAG: hypothetical protein AB7O24_14175 [Kofleriaceae bacterium]
MRLSVAIGFAVVALAVTALPAHAYPEFQFATGATRCSECHFAPGGGGLINDYGRDEAGSTISSGGDGRFLHGAFEMPAALALGGDVRLAGLARRVRGGNEAAVFPMQADLYARLAVGGVSVQATGGVLGAIREPAPFVDRLGSREHFAMYQPESRAWYVRAGRFFPVFGLRLPDHTAYVRRFTGRHSLEEPYGVAAGITRDAWDLHASLIAPFELHPTVGRHGWGGAASAEHVGDVSSTGLQLDVRRNEDGVRGWIGGTWKRWFEGSDLMLASELDAGLIVTDATREKITQLAGYAALTYRPGKPLGFQTAAHYFDPDAYLVGQERVALDGSVRWFPRAHFELSVLLRGEATVRELDRTNLFAMIQVHYFL